MHFTNPRLSRVAVSLASLLLAGATSADTTQKERDRAPSSAVAVPAEVDLGRGVIATARPGRVWLINRGDEPLEVLAAKGDCGCITPVDFKPVTLAPLGAHEVRFTMLAPKELGRRKTKRLMFTLGTGAVLSVPVSVEAAATDEPVAEAPTRTLRLAPAPLDLGRVSPGLRGSGSAWLINSGDRPVRVTDVKGSCGCIRIATASSRVVEPGHALEIPLTMKAPGEAGSKRAELRVAVDGDDPLRLPVTIEAVPVSADAS